MVGRNLWLVIIGRLPTSPATTTTSWICPMVLCTATTTTPPPPDTTMFARSSPRGNFQRTGCNPHFLLILNGQGANAVRSSAPILLPLTERIKRRPFAVTDARGGSPLKRRPFAPITPSPPSLLQYNLPPLKSDRQILPYLIILPIFHPLPASCPIL